MQRADPNNPNEKKKLIAAAVLGLAAILVLGYVFFGGSSKPVTTNANRRIAGAPTPTIASKPSPIDDQSDSASLQPIPANWTVPSLSEPNRNIFRYYEPPPKPFPELPIATATPPPTLPLMLSTPPPSNVFSRTTDF